MDYKNLKFEQAAYCFMMLYQRKEHLNEAMEQLVDNICFETVTSCHYDETNDRAYQKANAVAMLVCFSRTGYVLSEHQIKDFRKLLEISDDRSLFNDEDWSEYQADIKAAVSYLEWSEEKRA